MATITPDSTTLSGDAFKRVAATLYKLSGIKLALGKEGLVQSRLARRMRVLKLADYDQYLEYVANDASGVELAAMIDELTTNKTSFFRENEHFEYMRREVFPRWQHVPRGPVMWSAACSSGEEPYTLAMLVREELPPQVAASTRILATDLSTRMVERGTAGVYPAELMREVPKPLLQRHFQPAPALSPGSAGAFAARSELKAMVKFARLNLMLDWPMRGPFDIIFCRNVMIYFDAQTQEKLVRRFRDLLAPGGLLFVGHAESLTSLDHGLKYVQPAVYAK